MRKIFLSLALTLATLSMSAQSTVTHTVQRGETIESVAKKYGISVYNLQQANPSTKDYFYAGMKLTIPSAKTPVQNQSQNTNATSGVTTVNSTKSNPVKKVKEKIQRVSLHSDLESRDFTSVGVFFGHDFSDLVGMTYGVQGQYFLNNGFGATLTVGANYGLEDDADIQFRVGPSYVYPITNMFYVMGTACYTLTMADYRGNTGMVSGASLIPTVGVSIKKFKIGLNGDIHWRNGGDFGAGAFLSVGYSF